MHGGRKSGLAARGSAAAPIRRIGDRGQQRMEKGTRESLCRAAPRSGARAPAASRQAAAMPSFLLPPLATAARRQRAASAPQAQLALQQRSMPAARAASPYSAAQCRRRQRNACRLLVEVFAALAHEGNQR